MKGEHVYVLSYNGGVLGVYSKQKDANVAANDYRNYGYKGVKVEEHLVG